MPALTGLTTETCRVLLLKTIIKEMINKLIKRKMPRVILQQESQKTGFRGKASLCIWERFPVKWDFPFLLSFEWHLKNTAAEPHAHKVWSQVGLHAGATTAFSSSSEFSSLSCLNSMQGPWLKCSQASAGTRSSFVLGSLESPIHQQSKAKSCPRQHQSKHETSIRTNLCQTADCSLNLEFSLVIAE